jgi:NADPH:quinone reductase-like Zn-dependent oxidoreductase
VDAWPIVLGCDTTGEVVEVSPEAQGRFKVGDIVCGCTRLGVVGHSSYQDYHLFDANLALKAPKGWSVDQSAAFGVGTYTAGLAFEHLQVPLPTAAAPKKDEWVLIMGGASIVGLFAIQLFTLAGYKVACSNSAKTKDLVKSYGALASFPYNGTDEEQIAALEAEIGSKLSAINLHKVYDTVGGSAFPTGLKILERVSGEKLMTSVDPGFGATANPDDKSAYPVRQIIELGPIGRSPIVNTKVEAIIAALEQLNEKSLLKPPPIRKETHGGWEKVAEMIEWSKKGVSGEKLVYVFE